MHKSVWNAVARSASCCCPNFPKPHACHAAFLVTRRQEADKTPTRDRLKLIARVVNVDEWAKTGPLSGYVRVD